MGPGCRTLHISNSTASVSELPAQRCVAPAGNDSVAKATNHGTLAGPHIQPEASPPLEPNPHIKREPAPEPDSADQSAARGSLSAQQSVHSQQQQSPLQQQQPQQATAVQWVETDDLGVSKRQVAALPNNALPNGVLPYAQGSSQQPPTGLQEPQGGIEQQQGSLQQPQGNMHQLPCVAQAPQGSMQQPEGEVHGAEGSGGSRAEGQSEHQLSTEQADLSRCSEQLIKQQDALDADQVHLPFLLGPKRRSGVECCFMILFASSGISQGGRFGTLIKSQAGLLVFWEPC